MKAARRVLTVLAVVGLAGLGTPGHATPTIPKERIPPDTPPEVRVHIEELYSRDPVTRAYGAVRLARLGDQAEVAIPFLIANLGDDVKLEWEQRETDSPLEEIKKRIRGLHKEQETTPGREAAYALSRLAATAAEPLLAALQDPNAEVRMNAARALGGIRDRKAVGPLIALLKDKDPDEAQRRRVRCQAAQALGRLGDTEATLHLIATLKDEHWEVRRDAVRALGEIKDPRALDPMLKMLSDMAHVRDAAAEALLETRDPRAVEPLIVALKDRNKAVRRVAARLLGAIGDRRAAQPLIFALKDTGSDVRLEVKLALQRMSGEDFEADPDDWQRWWDLEKAKEEVEEKVAGDRCVACIAALQSPNWAARAYAAKALGEIRDRRAVLPLRGVLWDRDGGVRSAAARALGEIKDPRAVEPLLAALSDADKTVREEAEFALRMITGANFAQDTRQWTQWWEQNKSDVDAKYKRSLEKKGKEEEGQKQRVGEVEREAPRKQSSSVVWLLILLIVAVGPVAALIVIRMMSPR